MAAQRFARSAAAKTTAFHPESGGELSERGKEQQKEIKEALLAQQKEDEDRLIKIKQDRAAAEYAKLKKKALVEVGRMGKVRLRRRRSPRRPRRERGTRRLRRLRRALVAGLRPLAVARAAPVMPPSAH